MRLGGATVVGTHPPEREGAGNGGEKEIRDRNVIGQQGSGGERL